MAISTQMVKELREQTGAGIMDAKRALEAADGDMQKAAQVLRQKGLERADRKSDRVAVQGLVETYVHGGGRIGVMVEVNCETDFVARTPDFVTLAHDVAMQIAATDPHYVSVDDVPAAEMEAGIKKYGDQESFTKQAVLLEQAFIKDAKLTIGALIKDHIAKLGENVVIRRFARFELGKHADQVEG